MLGLMSKDLPQMLLSGPSLVSLLEGKAISAHFAPHDGQAGLGWRVTGYTAPRPLPQGPARHTH